MRTVTLSQQSNRKTLFLCVAGSVLEWYDFAIFSSLAAVISQVFFPAQNKWLGLFATFFIFASGFLIRPIGAVFLGNYGDKHGRKKALALSIGLMTFATIAMALVPGYTKLGIFAPCALLAMRLLQGFSVGAEYAGAITYLIECSHPDRKNLNTSFSLTGTIIGAVLGSLICALISSRLSEAQMLSYGWRIPFLLSFPLGYLGYYLRAKAIESPEYEEAFEKNEILPHPFVELMRHKKQELMLTFFLFASYNIIVYLCIVYMPTRLYRAHFITLTQMLCTTTLSLALDAFLVPCFGFWAECVGVAKFIRRGFYLLLIFAIPLFYLSSQNSWLSFFVAQAGLLLLAAVPGSVIPAFVASIFPTNVRFSGVSTGMNLSAAIFGGTAPLVGLVLEKLPYGFLWLSAYFMFFVGIALWRLSAFRSQ